jgi:deoxyribodipyrimidine photolyase-related protein
VLAILGNQLFPLQHLPAADTTAIFMAEDVGLCTYERHHQQKIVLFLAAMRAYADELRAGGYDMHYELLDTTDTRPFEIKLSDAMQARGDSSLLHFEIEDKPMESRLIGAADKHGFERTELESPMFTCSRSEFAAYASGKSRLLMADFYKWQRRRLHILIDDQGQPKGGRWSFDADNRKRLPKGVEPPVIDWPTSNEHVGDIIEIVKNEFADHPGTVSDFRWPTTRKQALAWLDDFIESRLVQFGPFEDALTTRSETVFHSLLSPYLNIGLLTPDEVIRKIIDQAEAAPIQSLEGFVRQVIGWREFVRGVYQRHSEIQDTSNFWSHDRELTDAWYEGATGMPPLDDTIQSVQSLGWAHHIPRLMVIGNLMTLCEIRPQSAHRWFMEMFIDSSEWVMGPNVYGMGLFSDGGIFATKPYICGSNYLLKMSDYSRGPWCDTVDGLYWRFIAKHRAFFDANPRLALMPKALDRLDKERRDRIFAAAEEFLSRYTVRT